MPFNVQCSSQGSIKFKYLSGQCSPMNRNIRPFVIVGVFWVGLFLFVIAGYSGSLGIQGISGFAVKEDGSASALGVQSIAIMMLLFTNIVTMFFLIREKFEKKSS